MTALQVVLLLRPQVQIIKRWEIKKERHLLRSSTRKDLLGSYVILIIWILSYRQWETTKTFKKGRNNGESYGLYKTTLETMDMKL